MHKRRPVDILESKRNKGTYSFQQDCNNNNENNIAIEIVVANCVLNSKSKFFFNFLVRPSVVQK